MAMATLFGNIMTIEDVPGTIARAILAFTSSKIAILLIINVLLLIVGGVNWGLVGLFQFDLVGWLLGGSTSVWSRIVFALVGLAALGCIPNLFSEEPEEE